MRAVARVGTPIRPSSRSSWRLRVPGSVRHRQSSSRQQRPSGRVSGALIAIVPHRPGPTAPGRGSPRRRRPRSAARGDRGGGSPRPSRGAARRPGRSPRRPPAPSASASVPPPRSPPSHRPTGSPCSSVHDTRAMRRASKASARMRSPGRSAMAEPACPNRLDLLASRVAVPARRPTSEDPPHGRARSRDLVRGRPRRPLGRRDRRGPAARPSGSTARATCPRPGRSTGRRPGAWSSTGRS